MKKILIATVPDDFHAVVVAQALRHKGAEAILWQSSDFPYQARETVLFEPRQRSFRIENIALDEQSNQFSAVWLRRPDIEWGQSPLSPEDHQFAHLQCRFFRRGLLTSLVAGTFCVNPLEAFYRCEAKLTQCQAALEVGLKLPPTACTNDPEIVRDMIGKHGRVVYKTFHPGFWYEDDAALAIWTAEISESGLVADHLLQAVPGIYQALIPKIWDLRVTMIGDRLFAVKILSQQTRRGTLDWRRASADGDLRLEPVEIAPEIAEQCRALLERLGLVFGCIDFVVTPEGETLFLEINQAGQFLFVERLSGLPLLDAMVELLLQGRPDFDWRPESAEVRLADFQGSARKQQAELIHRHARRQTPGAGS